jgi:hypothetical protein
MPASRLGGSSRRICIEPYLLNGSRRIGGKLGHGDTLPVTFREKVFPGHILDQLDCLSHWMQSISRSASKYITGCAGGTQRVLVPVRGLALHTLSLWAGLHSSRVPYRLQKALFEILDRPLTKLGGERVY